MRNFTRRLLIGAATILGSFAAARQPTQPTNHAMHKAEVSMTAPMDSIATRHMEMSPLRKATNADAARALALVKELRTAITKYRDTAAAVADGYEMFAPGLKTQKTCHFTREQQRVQGSLSVRGGNGPARAACALAVWMLDASPRRLQRSASANTSRWSQGVIHS